MLTIFLEWAAGLPVGRPHLEQNQGAAANLAGQPRLVWDRSIQHQRDRHPQAMRPDRLVESTRSEVVVTAVRPAADLAAVGQS